MLPDLNFMRVLPKGATEWPPTTSAFKPLRHLFAPYMILIE